MIDAPLALAFSAGLVATVNPCGFAMLPAYLSYFVGSGGGDADRTDALRRSLLVGGVVSIAFLVVFAVTGALVTAGFQSIVNVIPWLALAVGMLIVGLGIAMLAGIEMTVRLPKATRAGRGRTIGSIFGFGVSYAVASLSCTLPVFLSVVALQARRTDFLSGVATFIAYGVGMSMLLVAVTVAVGFGHHRLVGWLRRSARHINRIAAVILIAAGGYIVWFWATNLSSGAAGLGDFGAFRFVEGLSQHALEIVANHPLLWGVGFAVVIVSSLVAILVSRSDPEGTRGNDEPAPAAAGGAGSAG